MRDPERDDAVHIAAPWEPRATLCGRWWRKTVTLDQTPPSGLEGCWSCLQAADWMNDLQRRLDLLEEKDAEAREAAIETRTRE